MAEQVATRYEYEATLRGRRSAVPQRLHERAESIALRNNVELTEFEVQPKWLWSYVRVVASGTMTELDRFLLEFAASLKER